MLLLTVLSYNILNRFIHNKFRNEKWLEICYIYYITKRSIMNFYFVEYFVVTHHYTSVSSIVIIAFIISMIVENTLENRNVKDIIY